MYKHAYLINITSQYFRAQVGLIELFNCNEFQGSKSDLGQPGTFLKRLTLGENEYLGLKFTLHDN